MDTAFAHPHCPATYPTSPINPTILPLSPTPPQVRNDALVYLAFAVAGFAAVPTLFWLRDKCQRDKERRKHRAMLESLKAKLDATRISASKAQESPTCSIANSTPPEPIFVHENRMPGLNEVNEKKKRSKDRRKRGRDREPSRALRTRKCLPSSGSLPATETLCDPSVMDYTPRPSEQLCLSGVPDERRAPSPRSPSMLDIASPTPLPLISPSFCAPSPNSAHGCSETSSRPGQSRSTSVSPTTAPLTPPQLSSSVSLPPLVAIKEQETDSWLSQLSNIPHNDPAWDWDGQSSTYSVGSPSRAPSASECPPLRSASGREHVTNKVIALSSTVSSPTLPRKLALPSAPSLVFPSLNAHPPPGASLTTQIASLKGALEASRTREDKYRREAERWSKECDLIKWRWNEAADIWNRREAESQAQIHHLVLQLQTLTHAMQAASLSPPMSFLPLPGQTPFLHPMPFSSHHGSPFSMPPTATLPDIVNEDLAEAILKRPGSIRSSVTSNSLETTRSNGGQRVPAVEEHFLDQKAEPLKLDDDEVIEFEFPTLLDRRVNSPRADNGHEREALLSANDEVEIFH